MASQRLSETTEICWGLVGCVTMMSEYQGTVAALVTGGEQNQDWGHWEVYLDNEVNWAKTTLV